MSSSRGSLPGRRRRTSPWGRAVVGLVVGLVVGVVCMVVVGIVTVFQRALSGAYRNARGLVVQRDFVVRSK